MAQYIPIFEDTASVSLIIWLFVALAVAQFVTIFACRYFKLSSRANTFIITCLFGIVSGVIYNIMLPTTLFIATTAVTEAHEHENATEAVVRAILTHGDDDDDIEFGPYFRILGVSICCGFMFMYFIDYFAQDYNKKVLAAAPQPIIDVESSVTKPLVAPEEQEEEVGHHHSHSDGPEEKAYCTKSFVLLFLTYYISTGFAVGAVLSISIPESILYFLFGSLYCISLPICFTFGKHLETTSFTIQKKMILITLMSIFTSIFSLLFWGMWYLLIPYTTAFVNSLGYTFLCGMTIYILLGFYLQKVHIESEMLLSFVAAAFMAVSYPVFLLQH
ncbi:hypothetical protein WA158_005273 [Blastocystis sp. Blastoise]